MKKQWTKLAALVLCLCTFLSLSVYAKKAYPKPTEQFFVNDFAGVLQEADKSKMQSLGEALYQKTGAQMVVVTVPSMDGESVEDYAYHLANTWGIGDEADDSGVLLFFALNERKIRIEVGSGLEGQLPDGKTGRILDEYAIPLLRNNQYSEGLERAYWALCNETYHEFGLEMDEAYVPIERQEPSNVQRVLHSPKMQVAYIVGILLLLLFLRRRGIFIWGFPFGGGGGFSSGGGSGFSGGGGGGFSGGGGSFSGGGSSRDF